MKRAFVTGGTGFVGLNLIQLLLERGWQATTLHRPSSNLKYLGRFDVQRVEGDIGDPESVRQTMPGDLDAVFHVAANTNFWSRHNTRQTRDNVDGTRNVVGAALERGARRFIHTSSIAAYGLHDGPIDEETPQAGPSSWINYLRTKGLAEVEVRRGIERGLDAVIINPSNIIGPYDLHSWSTMIYLADAGRLKGAPPGSGSFCHVREVVQAHLAAVDRGRTGENYLLGGTETSYFEMVRIIAELTGCRVPTKPTPAWLLHLLARLSTWSYPITRKRPHLTPESATVMCRDMICRTDKAVRELSYRPVPLRTMLEDCHRWMAEEGRLSGTTSS